MQCLNQEQINLISDVSALKLMLIFRKEYLDIKPKHNEG